MLFSMLFRLCLNRALNISQIIYQCKRKLLDANNIIIAAVINIIIVVIIILIINPLDKWSNSMQVQQFY